MIQRRYQTRGAALLLALLLCGALLLVGLAAPASRPLAQASAAPQTASYRLDVTLDPAAKTVAGQGVISYRNPSADTLNELWLRLYLKAFSSLDTLWMQEANGQMRGFSVDPDALGDISLSRLSLAGGPDLLATASFSDTLLKLPLPEPLGPGQLVELEVEWLSRLPRVFARTGFGGRDDTFFMVGQWYPKMVVYGRGGWHNEPWHANAEFFHDFGRYEVSVRAPPEYVIAGAGVPDGPPVPVGALQVSRFVAENVTDFAFAASPDFRTRSRQAGGAEVVLYYLPEHESAADEYLAVAGDSLAAYGEWYGAYPHPRLSVVDVPDNAAGAGGMEYPTLITGGTLGAPAGSGLLALVVAHEVAHQWWPMQTATDEGRAPWLDEGITEYSAARFLEEQGRSFSIAGGLDGPGLDLAQYAAQPEIASNLAAWEYGGGYAAAVYARPAVGLITLERSVGTARFRAAMARYLREQRYQHPTAAEFRAALEAELGDLGWFFEGFVPGGGQIDYRADPIDNRPEGSSVRVIREGALVAPVDIRVTLASGRSETIAWDGAGPDFSRDYPPGDPVRLLEVDPDYKLYAELDRADNGAADTILFLPLVAIGARLALWTQMIVQAFGLFG